MKTCSCCKLEKTLENFYRNKKAKDGLTYNCKTCSAEIKNRWRANNPEKRKELDARTRERHREKRATTQRAYYQENKDYYKQKSIEYRTKYPEKFVGYVQKADPLYAKEYRAKNKDLIKYHRKKRKALIRGSIVNFSKEDYDSVLERFDYKCAISDSTDIHMDHFILVSTGYGDTVLGNMIPLDATLNLSKSASNPFEWIKTRNDIDRKRFEDVVFYLAEMNGLTTDEFEAHVYNCF